MSYCGAEHHPPAPVAHPGRPPCPQRYTASPRLPCIPSHLKSLLMAAVVMLILMVVIVTFLLLGLHITETHAEAVRGGNRGAAGSGDGIGRVGNGTGYWCSAGMGLRPPQCPLTPPPWQVLRMTIHGLDGEGTPQHLSMSKKERTGTFAVRDGLNASAVVVYDYSKVRGQRAQGRAQGQGQG